MEKEIREAFDLANIPEVFYGSRVCALSIDTKTRGVNFVLKLTPLLPYREIEILKKELVKAYILQSVNVQVQFENNELMNNLDIYKDYIIMELAQGNPIAKYAFEASRWEQDGDTLIITLRHGIDQNDMGGNVHTAIEKIMQRSNINLNVEFDEDIEEIKFTMPEIIPVVKEKKTEPKPEKTELPTVLLGKVLSSEILQVKEIDQDSGKVTVAGDLFYIDTRDNMGKDKKTTMVLFYLYDGTGSVICKAFIPTEKFADIKGSMKAGAHLKVGGKMEFDPYEREVVLQVKDINTCEKEKKADTAEEKRVELHMHTKMSAMDGLASAEDIVNTAKEYGHKAVAITDHGVVQAFPEALHTKDDSIKILYGTEAYFVNDCDSLIYHGESYPIDGEVVVFDIETTGLSHISDEFTEIGAVKIADGKITDTFSTFVNPGKAIPSRIVELTGITDEMVADAPSPNDAVDAFMKFCGDAPLIAHNADFDVSFIRENLRRRGDNRQIMYLDTLALCREIVTVKKSHKLDAMAKYFGIPNPSHHRAVNDAEVCAGIWNKCCDILRAKKISTLDEIDRKISEDTDSLAHLSYYHATIFAKNRAGIKNLYKLISLSHLKYFKGKPRIPKSEFLRHRDGLLIGSACEAGELFRAVKSGADEDTIDRLCEFYDYFEIQPLGNNMFMVNKGEVGSVEELKEINKKIIALGEKHGKLVAATCDVHFLRPEDEVYRRILMAGQKYDDADSQAPLYFRTTDEMLAEFDYLGEETARKVVIENTNKIADMIEDISPISNEYCPPVIEGSEEDIERMCYEKAHRIYGDPLPEIVETRLKRELDGINSKGYAVLYMIAHKLVKKSNDDGYLVGSRGSVGSSLVAYMSDITEVNSLAPHYICPECKYSEFITDGSYSSGCDMPDKNCPNCGHMLRKDGHDIPFETFLGFNADKEPDIDLNFSGEYQARAHKYTEELFGKENIFKAGTIGTIADKTAFGFVKNYYEDRGQTINKAELQRIVEGCTGVKRTTGQHPGGLIVLPKGHTIEEFTPVQHPADKDGIGIITTHFDYHSIDKNLLKLDLLGHDDPTVIRMLEDLTGIDAKKIPLDDKETMSIFSSTEALGVTKEQIGTEVGTYGVPEFGTRFTQQMLVDTRPTTFAELVRISGLSHGEDVWTNNAQDLVRSGTCTLSSCICTRDDIMLYLIKKGVPPASSFKIMESVRKGRGLTPEWEELMHENNVPQWYIDSCKKIKYMFPKAHACAYVTMAFRIAYCKVHYPMAFYQAYFSVRADDFDYNTMCHGEQRVIDEMNLIKAKGKEATAKEKSKVTILEVCVEMYERGLDFCGIDIYKSHPLNFLNDNGKIRPPLNSLPGLGAAAAMKIAEEREKGEFLAIDDMVKRTGVSKTVVEMLKAAGALSGMQESAQVDMFSLLA